MKLEDPQSLFGLHVHSCIQWLRPRNPSPPPAFGLIYEGTNSQPIVTHWVKWPCLAEEDAPDMANLWRELELAPGHGSLAG